MVYTIIFPRCKLLIITNVNIFNPFYNQAKARLLGMKDFQIIGVNIILNFNPLAIVGRGSETQLQLAENLSLLTCGKNYAITQLNLVCPLSCEPE